jgi:integrase
VARPVGDVVAGVVDDLVGADRADQLELGRAGHPGHLRAERLGQLHPERPNPAGRPDDQDPLLRLDLALIPKALEGGEPGDGHDRRLLKAEALRLGRKLVRRSAGVLGEGAVAPAEHRPFNPALMARPAGGKGKPHPVPTPAQVRELFAALADDPEFAVFVRLSTTAGLRPSEVCALRWLDMDLDAATVSVNGSIVTAKSLPQRYARKDPKSVHGERHPALDVATVDLLRSHRDRCEQLARQFDGRLASEAYVFARTPDGRTPLRLDTVSKRFTALVRQLGHGYTLYGLRRFMALQLGAIAEAGTVRERMGHGSLAVTSGYMHRVSEADRAAADYMGILLDDDAIRSS